MSAEKSTQDLPSIEWTGKFFKAKFPVGKLPMDVIGKEGFVLDFEVEPEFVYIVKIREAPVGPWTPGFITPFTNQQFEGLKPNTAYELQVITKSTHGESPPVSIKAKTNSHGGLDNIIPFPSKR